MSTISGEDAAKLSSIATQDWLLIIAIGMLASLPLYLYGLPLVFDFNHHYRTALGFYEAIVNGNYYPSWHPTTNGGYGDLSVRFYPPALYFMLSGFRMITRDWFLAGLLTATSLTTAGVLGMYLWARSLTSHYFALAAGLLFALTPFHVNELYQSGMYGQYAGASVLPFAFAFVERVIRDRRNSDVALLGLSYGLLVHLYWIRANHPLLYDLPIDERRNLLRSNHIQPEGRIIKRAPLRIRISCQSGHTDRHAA